MFRFENLEIWKEAINFSNNIYKSLHNFPVEEKFALADQLRRAAISISANIAEGSGSISDKDFANYLNIATKSVFEVVSLITSARDMKYISDMDFKKIHDEAEVLAKRIQAFRNSLK